MNAAVSILIGFLTYALMLLVARRRLALSMFSKSGRTRAASSEVPADSKALHSRPLWNVKDCALELLAWPDPVLDKAAFAIFARNPEKAERVRSSFTAPKGTWLWWIRLEGERRRARQHLVEAPSDHEAASDYAPETIELSEAA